MKELLLQRSVLVPVTILAFLGVCFGTVRFAFLAQTKAALLSGELPEDYLHFADAIDDRTFEAFLSRTSDTGAKAKVMHLLGWKQRVGMLDYLKTLSATDGKQAQHATLSVVAIESRIPFPGRDIVGEYYRSYAAIALRLAKDEGIPLREAAQQVADKLRSEGSFERGG